MRTRGKRVSRDKSSPNPDLILPNGTIYPDAGSRTHFEALAVREGRVTRVGSNSIIVGLKSQPAQKINLHGRTILPGFHDSHMHLLNYGMLLRTLDLSRSRSIEQIKKRVAERTSTESKDTWVLGRGWDHEKLRERRYPTREDLDGPSSKPVFLKRICGHVAVANSAALSLAGIDNRTSNPDGREIVRDSEGDTNGVLKETGRELGEN